MDIPILEPVNVNNPIVFMDINIGAEYSGRLIIELRKDVVPITAENFRALCTGEYGIGQFGKPLHYKNNRFHKVKRVFVSQSGDVVNNDGTSGESIYGPVFNDENFELNHNDAGIVSMANYGTPNTNNSQFFITNADCENLNGINVVVGRVLRCLGVIAEMEQCTTDDGDPTTDIIIVDCGEIAPGSQWGIECDDETTDKLPMYPEDWPGKFQKYTCDDLISILTTIRQSGNHFFTQARYYEARSKYRKANRYCNMFRKIFEYPELHTQNQNSEKGMELKQLDNFSVVNNINMAAVELKLKNYRNVKYVCTSAIQLNVNCSKAYYRRGQANLILQNFEEAIKDLTRANELVPKDKHILYELNRAKLLLAEYNRKQMNALKNLFNWKT